VERGGAVRLRLGRLPRPAGPGASQADPEALAGLINAGHSPAATAFSAREVDFSFVGFDSVEQVRTVAARMREKARTDHQRDIGVCTSALVVCRETEAEARAVYRSIIEQGDRVAADNLIKVLGIESQSFNDRIEKYRERVVAAGAPTRSSARPSR
jgi:alkanesulfonate monooxygenase SsuD/methylene tetrahydromethanopterin reductase-like flavin-dependent oxidoreductase (luciferase family)